MKIAYYKDGLWKKSARGLSHLGYRFIRPIVFCFDSENVHTRAISLGERLGRSDLARKALENALPFSSHSLSQNISGIHFVNPIGLAAGFDYEARLTKVVKGIGMGFATVGSITNLPYGGNTRPRLARLVGARSLIVNKGFKNLGIVQTLKNLEESNLGNSSNHNPHSPHHKFSVPIGISIGKTNTPTHKTQQEAIEDILSAFRAVEAALAAGKVPFSYYELNISCPNLHGSIEFYSPAHLEELLNAVFDPQSPHSPSLPVFIKMPIVKTNEETLNMLSVIARSKATGVILGNLQGDRNHPTLCDARTKEGLAKYPKGGLSGMATQQRSDELIHLVYKNFGKRFVIIGCGGVFNAIDAYRKIRAGASLIQMITGMIFEGPQLPAQINADLAKLLAQDGFKNTVDAVGVDVI
jgi:dihydroorotate dehydrogenase subfamily 2